MTHVMVTLIGEGPWALIDAGYPESAEETLGWVGEQTGGRLERLILTHHHYDHIGAAEALVGRTGAEACAHPVEMDYMAESAPALKLRPLEDGETLVAGGVRLEALLTPGHSPGHLAFWWAERRVLFGGDNVLMSTTTAIVPPKGNLGDYLRSLERMRALGPEVIYPGHGGPIEEPLERIDALLAHRAMRDAQVLDALASGRDTPEQIAAVIYEGLSEKQIELGAGVVLSHLDEFIEEGRVRLEGGRYLSA